MIRNELGKARHRQHSLILYCIELWASFDDPLVAVLLLAVLSAATTQHITQSTTQQGQLALHSDGQRVLQISISAETIGRLK